MSFTTLSLTAAILGSVAFANKTFPYSDAGVTVEPDLDARVDIDNVNRIFVDQTGRQVLFHGVNVVYKVDPYIPTIGEFDAQNSLNDEDIALLKKWGQNFVRLGVMWEAVEREEGVYDDNYLDQVEAMINKLGENGIYTLVDAHQDVLARSICGEGMPDFYAKKALKKDSHCMSWALDRLLRPIYDKFGVCTDMETFGFAKDENEDFLITDCQTRDFYTYYLTKQSISLFGHLFNNDYGLQDAFINYWDHTSARFANNPYVVGYDPLNEPFPANPAKDPHLFIPGHMDKAYLAPMYEKLYEKYQSHDSKQQMWFEPVPFPDEVGVLSGMVFHVGFDVPPGGEIGSDKHVLNDHTYCCQLSADECLTGEPQVAHAAQCRQWHEKRIGTRVKDAKRLEVPLVITEFGACLTEGPCSQEINQVCDIADEHLVGWAYWQFKTYADLTTSAGTGSEGFWNQDGTLQDYKVKALARSYMPYTQGILDEMKFNTDTAVFYAQFTFNSTAAESVAYLNQEYWYISEPDVQVFVNGAELAAADLGAVSSYDNNYYSFDLSTLAQDGDTVTIVAARQA